jgi:thiol-disulfide isomerase/thioredoxin
MKHSIHFLTGLFLLFTVISEAQNTSKTTQVSGQLIGNQVYTEISLRTPTKEVNVLATSAIQQDGKFLMEFAQAEPNIYKIFLADNNALLIILHPGDKVSMTLDAINLNNNPLVQGSQENQAFYDFGKVVSAISYGIDSVETAWKGTQGAPGSDSLANFLRNRYAFYDAIQKQSISQYILNNAGSLSCLAYIEKLDIDDYFNVYDAFDKASASKYPNNMFIQDLHRRIEIARKVAIGALAPEIKLPNPEGVTTELSSFRGKIVLIDFWASWCGPCRKENPHVVEVYKKYHDKGFEIFGVSLDRDGNNWKKAIQDDGLIWTHVSDLLYWKSEPAKAYGVNAIPCTFLIDKEGKIIGKKLRGESLSQKLEEIFGF